MNHPGLGWWIGIGFGLHGSDHDHAHGILCACRGARSRRTAQCRDEAPNLRSAQSAPIPVMIFYSEGTEAYRRSEDEPGSYLQKRSNGTQIELRPNTLQ